MIKKLQDKFPIIPEGEQLVRVKEIGDEDYAKFDKLVVIVEDEQGVTAKLGFNFVKDDGTHNDGAENAYAFMSRAFMNDQTVDEIDTNDLIGKFALAEVVHTAGSKGGTFVNVKKWTATDATFSRAATPSSAPSVPKKTAVELLAEARARKAAAGQQ